MGFVSFIIEEMPETVNDMTINFIGRLTADEFFKKSGRDTLTGEVYGDILYLVGGDEMLNSSDILRGYTDTIILAQLAEGDSYGYVISKNVQQGNTMMPERRRKKNIESLWKSELHI